MSVSVPLSYEIAVHFLIKNVQLILGSVGAEWPPFAISMKLLLRFMLSHTILYLLFVNGVCFFQFVTAKLA